MSNQVVSSTAPADARQIASEDELRAQSRQVAGRRSFLNGVDGDRVVSKLDADGMAERMDAIRLKQLLAPETLTEQELMCLQIEQAGFGCSVCQSTER